MTFSHRFDPASGPEGRTALVLHGTGGDEHSLVPFAQALLPGAALLSPRGRVLEGGAPRFFRRFAEGVFDYDSIRDEADALAHFVREASSTYGFDPTKVVAIGYSNGANAAWSTVLRHPEVASELVLFRPMVTLEDEQPDLRGKRAFVATGRDDMMVPLSNAERLVAQMRGLGMTVDHLVQDAGHALTRSEIEAAALWLGAA